MASCKPSIIMLSMGLLAALIATAAAARQPSVLEAPDASNGGSNLNLKALHTPMTTRALQAAAAAESTESADSTQGPYDCSSPRTVRNDGSRDGRNPLFRGQAVDWCRDGLGMSCGWAAAIEFCKQLGLELEKAGVAVNVNRNTIIPTKGWGCVEPDKCIGFDYICCQGDGGNQGSGGYNGGPNTPGGGYNGGYNTPSGGYNGGPNTPGGGYNGGPNTPGGGYNGGSNTPGGGYSGGSYNGGGYNGGSNTPGGGYNGGSAVDCGGGDTCKNGRCCAGPYNLGCFKPGSFWPC